MAFNRPTLSDLIQRAYNDFNTYFAGVSAALRRSNFNVLAKVHSAVTHHLYGFISFVAEQLFPDTAEGSYLDRIASFWLPDPKKAASFAVGNYTFNGTNSVVIPALTRLIRADGIEYETSADVTIVAGVATAVITALTAGQIGNAAAATPLNLSSPIPGVNGGGVVAAGGLVFGADVEAPESIRGRIKNRVQNPPHGGAKSDYVTWALEVAGVTRAWSYPLEQGAGTVVVRFVRDNDANLIPDAGEVAAVQAYIDPLRPVTAKGVYVVAPIAAPINFSIQLTPNTLLVKAAVEAELRDLIKREGEPAATILISHIREAISIAAGENNYEMTVPAADVANGVGYIPTFGAITWL